MRFLYVSRQFNQSGFCVLKHLLQEGVRPVGVLMPTVNSCPELDKKESREVYIEHYFKRCEHENARPLRFFGSIKLLAESHNVPVYIRNTLKDGAALDWIKSLSLDLIVLGGGWPELIPLTVLNAPTGGAINTHPSLLPEFRGTDIHRWQVLYGVNESGVSIHYMDGSFDTGDVLAQSSTEISCYDTPQELFERVSIDAGAIMEDVLIRIEGALPSKLKGRPQPLENRSRRLPKWNWEVDEFTRINWGESAERVLRRILANSQESFIYNGSYSVLLNSKILVREARLPCQSKRYHRNGCVLDVSKNGVLVGCGEGSAILLTKIQVGTQDGFPASPNYARALSSEEIQASQIIKTGDIFI